MSERKVKIIHRTINLTHVLIISPSKVVYMDLMKFTVFQSLWAKVVKGA